MTKIIKYDTIFLIKKGGYKLKEEKKNIMFSKDFFIKPRPHVKTKEKSDDIIPFKWSNEVLNGKKKAILYSAKNRI